MKPSPAEKIRVEQIAEMGQFQLKPLISILAPGKLFYPAEQMVFVLRHFGQNKLAGEIEERMAEEERKLL